MKRLAILIAAVVLALPACMMKSTARKAIAGAHAIGRVQAFDEAEEAVKICPSTDTARSYIGIKGQAARIQFITIVGEPYDKFVADVKKKEKGGKR